MVTFSKKEKIDIVLLVGLGVFLLFAGVLTFIGFVLGLVVAVWFWSQVLAWKQKRDISLIEKKRVELERLERKVNERR